MQIGKEEVKLFVDDIFRKSYILQIKFQGTIDLNSRVQAKKINTQLSMAFLYANNDIEEREIKKSHLQLCLIKSNAYISVHL